MLASANPDEQVLATAEHLVDDMPRQIRRGELRHPNVAPGQCLTRECLAKLGGGAEDGVAFRHPSP